MPKSFRLRAVALAQGGHSTEEEGTIGAGSPYLLSEP